MPVSEPRSEASLPDPTLDVSIVVPYYNPGNRLRTTVEDMVRVLDASGMTFEIITVSDGSTDGSPFTLEGFPESVVRRMNFAKNFGKGHALRAGLGTGRGRYLGFIDADGDISPELLAPFVSIMQSEQPDIIIGSKRHPESSVHYPPLRRLYSWGYQHLIALLFRLHIKDTQVGIKLVDRAVIADVLPLLRESVTPEQAAKHLIGCAKGDLLLCFLFPRPQSPVSREETLAELHLRLDLFFHGVLRQP